jgi:hypothetical protein
LWRKALQATTAKNLDFAGQLVPKLKMATSFLALKNLTEFGF